MKWKCLPVGVRDVKDRDAEVRMEWNIDYTIAVAELKKQVEECCGVQGQEVKKNAETTAFLEQ